MKRNFLIPQRFPSLKRFLVELYLDIERVVKRVDADDIESIYDEYLGTFEKMVILLEDRRYFQHAGVDLHSIARVLVKATIGRSRGGASTIEMQFVRRATGRYDRTIARKLREMLLAKLLGFHMSKALVLRSYLACAYFGHGLWGAHRASEAVFQKPVSDLSLDEAAFLAALMVYPLPRAPTPDWRKKADRRASYGLRLFRELHQRLDNLKVA